MAATIMGLTISYSTRMTQILFKSLSRCFYYKFMVPSSTTNPLTRHREIQPIPWQMDRHYHLLHAHLHQCASHPADYAHELIYLCDATWMLPLQGLYSLSGKTSYRKISWSLEAARFGFGLFQLLWNLTGISAAALPRCLSNFRAIRSL